MQMTHTKTKAIREKLQDTEEARNRWLTRLLRAANAVSRLSKRANYYSKLLADDAAREVKRIEQKIDWKKERAIDRALITGTPVPQDAKPDVTNIPWSEMVGDDLRKDDPLDARSQPWNRQPNAADEKAKAEIVAGQQAKAKVKAKASSEKSRAKRRGELRKMPLSGKAALEHKIGRAHV